MHYRVGVIGTQKKCKVCKAEFTVRGRAQKYCTKKCQNVAQSRRLRYRAKQYLKLKAAQRTTVSAA